MKVYALLKKCIHFFQKCIHFFKSVYTLIKSVYTVQKCIHFHKSVYTFIKSVCTLCQKCIHFWPKVYTLLTKMYVFSGNVYAILPKMYAFLHTHDIHMRPQCTYLCIYIYIDMCVAKKLCQEPCVYKHIAEAVNLSLQHGRGPGFL